MLSFNQLLESSGVPPDQTRMVRHQSKRGPLGKSPTDLWRAQDGTFEQYQNLQSEKEFSVGDYVASFVPGPSGETVFVGLYRVLDMGKVEDPAVTCPIGGISAIDHFIYTMERLDALDEYNGRLVIDWGKAFIAWNQWAGRQPKAIVEIRAHVTEPPFPGHIHFISTIQALADVPATWKSNLTNARGVYLLVSKKTGQQYVGSAVGSEGFWGRWMAYAHDGHGGNELMKLTADSDYQVSILEVAASSASESEILRLEALWMRKLTTTTNGLNNKPGKRTKKGIA
ncbi:GIY-YIG nuclease family protein [Dyella jiangningensis]|uniref:GIY-YIG nuclease family protein n=1 Tax=Dyella jiangningensis TaxID=1379159 RepID=UPI00241057B1|nr:GIY-YIG nuclease family protein [Dyella jiangningensis]MDG2539205.1 GIY-YIG nuclease family protein [Dyella jiangningensis]